MKSNYSKKYDKNAIAKKMNDLAARDPDFLQWLLWLDDVKLPRTPFNYNGKIVVCWDTYIVLCVVNEQINKLYELQRFVEKLNTSNNAK